MIICCCFQFHITNLSKNEIFFSDWLVGQKSNVHATSKNYKIIFDLSYEIKIKMKEQKRKNWNRKKIRNRKLRIEKKNVQAHKQAHVKSIYQFRLGKCLIKKQSNANIQCLFTFFRE